MEIRKSTFLPTESPAVSTGLAERGAQTPMQVPVSGERSSIKALDLPAALQILLAEVELALSDVGFKNLIADAPPRTLAPLSPTTAARALVEWVLSGIPLDEATPQPAWTATVERLLQALSRGSDAAIDRVSAWRHTPSTLATTLQEVRSLVLTLLTGGQPALLSRPEWLGLAEALQRVRRRRRRGLLLTDTDVDLLELSATDEPPATPSLRGDRR